MVLKNGRKKPVPSCVAVSAPESARRRCTPRLARPSPMASEMLTDATTASGGQKKGARRLVWVRSRKKTPTLGFPGRNSRNRLPRRHAFAFSRMVLAEGTSSTRPGPGGRCHGRRAAARRLAVDVGRSWCSVCIDLYSFS